MRHEQGPRDPALGVTSGETRYKDRNLLVSNEDLEGRDEVAHWNRLVTLPLVEVRDIINEDDEVVILALVVDLGL